jgi:preprotein translocase subunit Sec61beta
MVKFNKGSAVQSPSSSLGIMRFFDADSTGPKMSPLFVIGIIIVVIVLVLGLKWLIPV